MELTIRIGDLQWHTDDEKVLDDVLSVLLDAGHSDVLDALQLDEDSDQDDE